jgi:hypothetical protein
VNARVLGVLVVLLVVLGGGALLMKQQSGGDKPADAGLLGQPLLKGLQAADVAAIVIRQPKATLSIQKKDERWTIAERNGYPADFDKVRDFVLKAIAAKVGQTEPIGDKDRLRLNLDENGTAVEFQGAGGKPLARFTAGNKYFRSTPENPDKAIGDGRYVALPGDEKRVYVISDPLAQASTRSADWVSRTGIEAEKVVAMEVRDAAGATWKIERQGDSADWKLVGLRGDEKLEITRANAAAYTFARVEIADVAPPQTRPEDAGLDKPSWVVTATTMDGLSYKLSLGKPEGDNLYARIEVTGEPKVAEGKDAGERAKKLAERLPREKALAAHIVLVPKSKLDDFLKKRADLLAKKEEKKKP